MINKIFSITFLSAIILCTAFSTNAQQKNASQQGKTWISEMRDYKMSFLVKETEMTDEQKEKFAPLYTEMETLIYKTNREARVIEQQVTKAGNNVDEKKYEEAAKAMSQVKEKLANIENKYFSEFSKILSKIIRTTFIVGFPGETEEDFDALCEFVREAKFEHMGAFTYSREEGTPAYDFEDQIDEQIKQDRCDILMGQQMVIDAERNEKLLGRTIEVLCEDYDVVSETYYGRSYMDAAEIDGKVFFTSDKKIKSGSFVKIKIDSAEDYDLIGHALG